jgi:hypothetical protein
VSLWGQGPTKKTYIFLTTRPPHCMGTLHGRAVASANVTCQGFRVVDLTTLNLLSANLQLEFSHGLKDSNHSLDMVIRNNLNFRASNFFVNRPVCLLKWLLICNTLRFWRPPQFQVQGVFILVGIWNPVCPPLVGCMLRT